MADPKSHMKAMAASMEKRTGKTLEQWVEIVRANLPEKKTGRLKWLKETYGLGQSSAFMILDLVENGNNDPADQYEEVVNNQYKKENEALRPLFEFLSGEFYKLGDDVKISPCKAYVPFYRKKQFVSVKPMKGKLHVAIGLPVEFEHERLESSADMKVSERMKHKFVIESKEEYDEELRGLVAKAYELN